MLAVEEIEPEPELTPPPFVDALEMPAVGVVTPGDAVVELIDEKTLANMMEGAIMRLSVPPLWWIMASLLSSPLV